MREKEENPISKQIIGAAIEVHRELGPGLLESVYQRCLEHELKMRGLHVDSEVLLPVRYKGLKFDAAYRLDLVVENLVIIELKAVDTMLPVFTAQLLSYLKLTGKHLGLLINFNVPQLRQGVKRVVNDL